MKVKEWMREWLENQVKITAKERTYKKYRALANKYIEPVLGAHEMEALTVKEMYAFSGEIKAKGLAASTVNCIITVLRSAWKAARRMGIVTKPLTDVIVRPPAAWKKTECLDAKEQRKLELYILNSGEAKLFGILLALYSGLRIGELLALTWEDIDLKKGTVCVTKSCHDSWETSRYVKVIDDTKTRNSERIIPLPRQILSYLKELKKTATCRFVVTGRTEYGAQIRTYQRTFELTLKKLKIKHKCFHSLRHTFATRALEIGMDVKTLSEILGHKNPMVTLKRYAHSLMEHKAEMMNKMGRNLPCGNKKSGNPLAADLYIE